MKPAADRHETDRDVVSRNFNAAAVRYDKVAVLQHTVGERLLERLALMRIDPARILDLGSGTGTGARQLAKRFRRARVVQLDFAEQMLKSSGRLARWFRFRRACVCADATSLPFPADAFGLVYSNLMLQWCNEPMRVFAEAWRVTRPGGLFIFTSFGPDTLLELRDSWSMIDNDAHVNAFLDMHDIGDALIRSGFVHPVMECERFTLTYADVRTLCRELKLLGAGNANRGRRRTLTGKDRLTRAVQAYEKFRVGSLLPATYEVIYGHAWLSETKAGRALDSNAYTVPVSSIKKRSY
jgi:malonyl-CoA O-methyltransferase